MGRRRKEETKKEMRGVSIEETYNALECEKKIAEGKSLEEIAEEFPELFLKSLHASLLIKSNELKKWSKRRRETAAFFLSYVKEPKFIESLKLLKKGLALIATAEASKTEDKKVDWKE